MPEAIYYNLAIIHSTDTSNSMIQTSNNSPEIATLLPHAGAMCLLQRIIRWDEFSIECGSFSHSKVDNPLRENGRLPVYAGIEYAAQAMAIHGTLSEGREGRPRAGVLAVVSKLLWHCSRLDDLDDELTVSAQKLADNATGFCYGFTLRHSSVLLLEGQAVVALRDSVA